MQQKIINIVFIIVTVLALGFILQQTHGISFVRAKTISSNTEINALRKEVIVLNKAPNLKYLGRFRVTAYCSCEECSEEWGMQTSTGATAKEGVTIAVDPSVISYGTDIVINGHTYKAQDTGGLIKGKRIDIYFENHADVDAFGVQYLEVYARVKVS